MWSGKQRSWRGGRSHRLGHQVPHLPMQLPFRVKAPAPSTCAATFSATALCPCPLPAYVDGPHPLGPVQLVATNGHEVDVHVVDADRNLAHSLHQECDGGGRAQVDRRSSVAVTGRKLCSMIPDQVILRELYSPLFLTPRLPLCPPTRTCAASVWRNAPPARHMRPISAIG